MDNTNNSLPKDNMPEGLDEFLADQDPQSAVASQGLNTLGHMALESEPVQNIITGAPLTQHQEMLNAAIAGDPMAQQALAAHSLGSDVMGSIKAGGVPEFGTAPKVGGAMNRIREILGVGPEVTPQELKSLVEASIAKGSKDFTPKDLSSIHQNIISKRPKSYAEGGDVEPEGLDEFINSIQQPMVGNSTTMQTDEPAGLDEFIAPELKEEKYGTLGQQAKTALEGAGRGLVGPLAPMAEKALGIDPEDIRAREEVNPITHMAGEAAGLIAPALVTGGTSAVAKAAAFSQAGLLEKAGAELALKLGVGETLASKIGVGAAKSAVENALFTGSDEVSKMILQDPHQSAQTAVGNIGLAALLGGGIGATVSGTGALWRKAVGGKASQLVEDFKGRLNEHITNPDPAATMNSELSEYYSAIKGSADEVYGAGGLKAQDIHKAMPEMHEGMLGQAEAMSGKLQESIDKMIKNPNSYPPRLVSKLQGDLEAFQTAVSKDTLSPGDIFNATQDLKQTLQGYSKFDKFVKPVDEAYDFVQQSKGLARDLREALEDTGVWGNAAKRQKVINEAFKEYLPTLKDFEKKFTVEVAGEKTIDPAKINTYLNQVGKPNAEIKQTMLKNFLEASEKYKKVIDDTHLNLGMDAPIMDAPLNVTKASLNEKTLGAKLADAFVDKHVSGQAAGGAAGSLIGGMMGHPALGAMIGKESLGPFFSSVLPSIAKSLLKFKGNAQAFRAAVDYAAAVAKGEALMTKSTVNLFVDSKDALPIHAIPSEKDIIKLNKSLRVAQANPEELLNKENHVQKYMPENAQAMDEMAGNAVTYLNGLRTDLDKKAPLDSKPIASSTQKAEYTNALMLAQQPLLILNKVKDGRVTPKDMAVLNNLYPAFVSKLQSKVMESMTNHISKGHSIPYKTRLGLFNLLGTPMDSTMASSSIMAAQVAPGQLQQPDSRAPSGVKSSPALQKLPNMYQTPGQSRQAHRQKP